MRTIVGTPCQTLPLIDVAPGHYFHKGIILTIKQRLEIALPNIVFLLSIEQILTNK
jgi:hypothetical protein